MSKASCFLFVAAVCGCGRDPGSSTAGDASTGGGLARGPRADAIVATIAHVPALRGRLGAGVTLARDALGFTTAHATALAIHAPTSAEQPLLLEPLRAPSARVAIRALGAAASAGTTIDGAVVYEDAFVDTDLVQVVAGEHAEELRLLRSSRAPTEERWAIDLSGPLSSVTTDGERVRVDDAHGAILETEPMFAIDARGERRSLRVRIEGTAPSYVVVATLDAHDLAYPVVIDPTWSAVGTTTARYYHASVLIGGRVLAAGGIDTGSSPITGAIFFDGASVTAAPALPSKRDLFTLSPTTGGRVAAIGGFTGTAALANTDLFDGATWTAGPALTTARYAHTASVLGTGVIVVAGGYGSAVVTTAEQFNGTSWSSAGTLKTPRYSHAAVAYRTSGGADRVLLVGGYDSGGVATTAAEVWDGATWTTVAPMGTGRAYPTATLLASGRILVAGGRTGATYLDTGEVYDPIGNTWTPVTNKMANGRAEHAAILLGGPKSYALVAGGYVSGTVVSNTVDLYDPATNAFISGGTASPNMTSARTRFTLTAMTPATGEVARIAAIGGFSGSGTFATTVDLFAPKADGVACSAASECYAPYCTGNLCCNAASCSAGYTCLGGSCATSCTGIGPSAACVAGYYCNGSACVAKKTDGTTCGAGLECSSGNCADGVCCNLACAGQCEACNVGTSKGTCVAVSGAPVSPRAACVGSGAGTTCGIACNGTDRTTCHYATTAVACGTPTCTEGTTGGTETHASKCDGAGTCPDTPTTCGAYKCDATACKTACDADTDCFGGYHCDTAKHECLRDASFGMDCKTSAECGKLTCVDLKCCGSPVCGAGESCALPGKEGSCSKKLGTPCTLDTECGSGHCVDKVCCDAACGGQCEACDVKDHVGTCTPVDGTPHAPRSPCDAKAANDCARTECAGATARDRCAGFPNKAAVSCGVDSCTAEGKLQEHGSCDGAGGCKLPTPATCAEYTCDKSKGACFAACTTGDQCATGYQCDPDKHVCIQGAHCSTDRAQSIDKTGAPTSCSPYLCGTDGKCPTECASTDQCAQGFSCDVDRRVCAAAGDAPASDGGGGCGYGGSSTTGAPLVVMALLGLAGLASRRRRAATN